MMAVVYICGFHISPAGGVTSSKHLLYICCNHIFIVMAEAQREYGGNYTSIQENVEKTICCKMNEILLSRLTRGEKNKFSFGGCVIAEERRICERKLKRFQQIKEERNKHSSKHTSCPVFLMFVGLEKVNHKPLMYVTRRKAVC